MGRYVARRLLLTIPVLIGASFLIFAMVYALPGDPIRALAGDRPWPRLSWPSSAKTSTSTTRSWSSTSSTSVTCCRVTSAPTSTRRPVIDTIARALPVTIKLTAVAVFFEIVIGITAGVLAGIRRNSFFDNLVLVSTTIIVSIPILVLAFVAQYFFGLEARARSRSRERTTACTAISCRASCWPPGRWRTSPG